MRCWLALGMLMAPLMAWSGPIYTCVDATGHTVYADKACTEAFPPSPVHGARIRPDGTIDAAPLPGEAAAGSEPVLDPVSTRDYQTALDHYSAGRYQEAFPVLLSAARNGNGTAQNLVGDLYHRGDGVARNNREATAWYERAAKQGNVSAWMTLGRMYETGDGIGINRTIARHWYAKAAAAGNTEAQSRLAFMNAEDRSGRSYLEPRHEPPPFKTTAPGQASVPLPFPLPDLPAVQKTAPETTLLGLRMRTWAYLVLFTVVGLATAGLMSIRRRRKLLDLRNITPADRNQAGPLVFRYRNSPVHLFFTILGGIGLAVYAGHDALTNVRPHRILHLVTLSPEAWSLFSGLVSAALLLALVFMIPYAFGDIYRTATIGFYDGYMLLPVKHNKATIKLAYAAVKGVRVLTPTSYSSELLYIRDHAHGELCVSSACFDSIEDYARFKRALVIRLGLAGS